MTRKTKVPRVWNSGYYCAVAQLLHETKNVDMYVMSLFERGRPELADDVDQDLFRKYGLMPPNADYPER